ncbi:MAG: glycosyl hydrolase 53 family protein [Mucilaginibacter sp.]|nr:glycosyl hydrolase 53 family protein [Mucilaginibacter sp.]
MIKLFFRQFAIVIGASSLLFTACKKETTDTVEPIKLSASADSIMAATTSSTSLLAGSSLQLGINGHPLGDKPYLAVSATKQISMLNNMNMTWYRVDMLSQADGTITVPTLLDPLLSAAAAGNVKILPMLNPRTLDYNDSEANSYKKGKTLGANFASKYAKYFTYYELGNDLDLRVLLPNTTGQSQAHYDRKKFNTLAAYLKGMDEGLKSKDADAKTMISAGWLHYGFLRMCDWYGVKFDVVAYHWYSDMEAAAPKSPNNIPDITKKLGSLFPKKPIWFTEFNYRYKSSSTTNESDQQTFVKNFINKCKANAQVKVAIVYELFDEPAKTGAEASYGIMKWATQFTVWKNKLVASLLGN